jgi:hypothetical protein
MHDTTFDQKYKALTEYDIVAIKVNNIWMLGCVNFSHSVVPYYIEIVSSGISYSYNDISDLIILNDY